MADIKVIFETATSGVAIAAMAVWADVFADMRNRLSAARATEEETNRLKSLILNAIDNAEDRDLNGEERVALKAVLLTAFDGHARAYPTHLAPKARFLRQVAFADVNG